MKPFTQKHFGKKGTSTDDTNSMTKGAATMMKQSAIMMYGGESPVKQKKEGETKEQYGKRVYEQAMNRVKTQKKNAAEKRKQEARDSRSSIKVSMGLGTSRTSKKIKLPKVKSGMGTSYTTHKTRM
jgi:hypothetical protein